MLVRGRVAPDARRHRSLTTNVSRRAWYIIIGVAFAVHNAEETTAAPRLLEFMQSGAPIALGAFYEGVNAAELRFSLAILTLGGLGVTAFAARFPITPGWAYAMLVFAAVIGVNAFAHIVMSGVARTYMPGLVTAVLLTLPVAISVLLRARRDSWVSTTAYWTAIPVALVIHGPVLVFFVRTTIAALRVVTGSAA
jgi:hypothetical protein